MQTRAHEIDNYKHFGIQTEMVFSPVVLIIIASLLAVTDRTKWKHKVVKKKKKNAGN